MSSIYSKIEISKTGSQIPILKNGKSLESKYNPEREAETIINEIQETYEYFIITGICSGILIKKLIEKFPKSKVLCIENSEDDITFLKQIDLVQNLAKMNNIIFTDINNLITNLINSYIPAKYGAFKLIERRTWNQENNSIIDLLQKNISKAIGIISADYSVQVHFGKIWQQNILNNLKLISNMKETAIEPISNSKNAYIIAAGPSLDSKISALIADNNKYVISTDTAYSTLLKYNIIPDIVISIDGQYISSNHFIKISPKTTFLFDICSNFSAARHIYDEGGKLFFFKSGHPFSELINIYTQKTISSLYTGSGTVTIAATDFAIKSGFKNITIYGADFGYINEKPYSKGTYFDSLYNINTTKVSTNENNFNSLMFRSELIKKDKKSTTKLFTAYKESFEDYLRQQNVKFEEIDNQYVLNNANKQKFKINSINLDMNDFMKFFGSLNSDEYETPLLPLIAWFRENTKTQNFDELLKLAHNYILSYN